MVIRVSTLNSAQPHTGTKPLDGEIDIFRTHYVCPGRLPHAEHEMYPNGVCELSGSDIIVKESAWLVNVNRANNVASYDSFNIIFQVLADELVPTGGVAGTVIARVFNASVQLGAVTSNDGAAEGQLEFISGANLTDAAIDAAVGSDHWVRVCDFAPTGTTPVNAAASGTATASNANSFSPPANGNDSDAATYWYNQNTQPLSGQDHWWAVDLGAPTAVDSWQLDWFSTSFASSNFDIQSSPDGVNWSVVTNVTTGSGAGTVSGAFPVVTARSVLLLCWQRPLSLHFCARNGAVCRSDKWHNPRRAGNAVVPQWHQNGWREHRHGWRVHQRPVRRG